MIPGEEEDGDPELRQGVVIFRLDVSIDTDDGVPVFIGEDNVIAIVEEMLEEHVLLDETSIILMYVSLWEGHVKFEMFFNPELKLHYSF